jgi:hypothetical protein
MNTLRTHSSFLLLTLLLAAGAGTAPVVAQDDGCAAELWGAATVYYRGDRVSHGYHEWKAKRVSEGVEPGTHKPTWQDQGACADEPPPPPPPPAGLVPLQIFGVWHAGNHYADWALPREYGEFDYANHWIIDQGDGTPSVNLVVLSFLQPMQVLNMEPDDPTTGVPVGMEQWVVDYFKGAGIRVMMSIGGVTYTDYWDEALATNATLLGLNAAAIASHFGVGIEIDYERNVGANVEDLQLFIDAYRSVHAYDASGANPAARLTIDLAAGGRYLQELNRHATIHWLDNASPVLDYANAMVARSSGTPDNWQEHIDGKPQYDPPIPPKAPNRFTGGLYLKGNLDNCLDFFASEQWEHADYVRSVQPNGAGTTNGMLGYMFWAAEFPSARKNYVGTVPPNTCEDGMGTAMSEFEVAVPMPSLRQN